MEHPKIVLPFGDLPTYSRLKDEVTVITGASNGIGKGIAELFAAEGSSVVLADVDEESGLAVVQKIKEKGGKAHFVKTDVSVEQECARLMDVAEQTFGKITILVNNAAIFAMKDNSQTSAEDWHVVLQLMLQV